MKLNRLEESLKMTQENQKALQEIEDNRSLEEDIEEYRLKRLSKEFTFFGGVRD